MSNDTVLTGEQIEGFAHRQLFSLTAARKQVLEIEQAVLQSAEVQRLREALEDVSQWMDSQADAQSKGGHATFDIMMLREKRDIARAALAAMEKQP